MIRCLISVNRAKEELRELVESATAFSDCNYEAPRFKFWQENVRSFLKRTYDVKESKEKLSAFDGITFISAGLDEIFPSVGRIEPATSGLGEAIALLTAWRDDLTKRNGEPTMELIKRILIAISGLAAVAGISYLAYIYVSNRDLVNNGTMNNVNLGDHSIQQSVK